MVMMRNVIEQLAGGREMQKEWLPTRPLRVAELNGMSVPQHGGAPERVDTRLVRAISKGTVSSRGADPKMLCNLSG
jgi:hypothetical protein